MLVPPLPLPVNLRWRLPVDLPAESANRAALRAAGDLGGHQHGVVSRAQLLRLGFSDHVITGLLGSGVLRPLHRGVFAVGHRAVSDDGRRLAALLACRETGALCAQSASAALGYGADDDVLHVVVADGVHHARPGLVVHRSRTLDPSDVMTVRKLAVTRPARTLIDLAAAVPDREALRAADVAMRRGCTPAALRRALLRLPKQPGRRLMAHYLDTRRASALRLRSELERRGAELLLASDLPRPAFNVLLDVGGERLEVDVWWREHRLVLEFDGRAYHEGVVAELEDARRDALLEGGSIAVRRAAWWDVTREPGRLLATVGRSLRRPSAS